MSYCETNNFANKNNSNQFSYYSNQAKLYSWVKLSKDENSVMFNAMHQDFNAPSMPSGVRTFQKCNHLYWSRVAKAAIVRMRNEKSKPDYLTENEWIDFWNSRRKDFFEKAKSDFKLAMKHRREDKHLLKKHKSGRINLE